MILKFLTRPEFLKKIDEIIILYKSCFTAEISREYFIWKYLNNPYENEIFIAVAEDKNTIVAFYGVSPIKLSSDMKGALSLNIMTNSNYSGQGLFVKLATMMTDKLKALNYDCLICFPNYLSNPIFISKLGWKDIYEIPRLTLSTFTINDKFHKPLEDSGFLMNYDSILDVNNDMSEKKYFFKKDISFLKWRIMENPLNKYINYVYEINGVVSSFITVRIYKDELNIVMLHYSSVTEATGLIQQVINIGVNINAKIITAWSPINSSEHSIYERFKFLNERPITYFAIDTFNQGKDTDIENYNNWKVESIDDNIY